MTEQQAYELVEKRAGFELRRYAPTLLAEVEVSGNFSEAGNAAFGVLVSYISGTNSSREKISMTAPVLQSDTALPDVHRVAFVLPEGYSFGTLPMPLDSRIAIRELPEHLGAARSFAGGWGQKNYAAQREELRKAVAEAGLKVLGQPRYARFDPPWKPGFLRRNEVVLPVSEPGA